MRRHHLVESSYPISLFESNNSLSNGSDISGDIISWVGWFWGGEPFWEFPIFWVGSRDDYLDEDLSC